MGVFKKDVEEAINESKGVQVGASTSARIGHQKVGLYTGYLREKYDRLGRRLIELESGQLNAEATSSVLEEVQHLSSLISDEVDAIRYRNQNRL